MGGHANVLVAQKMKKRGIDESTLSLRYARVSEKSSKVMLLLLIPLTALLLWAMSFYRRKPFFDHLIFSTEINIFFVLATFLLLPIVMAILAGIFPLLPTQLNDEFYTPITIGMMALFMFFAFRRFYNDRWWLAIPKALAFPVLQFIFVQTIYRMLLFELNMALL